MSRIAILWDDRITGSHFGLDDTEAAAKTLGLTLQSVPMRSPEALEAATAVRGRADALNIFTMSSLFSYRRRLPELAMKHRLPTVVGTRDFVEAGCLASYGTDYPDLFRRAVTFVDKILKGAKPKVTGADDGTRQVLTPLSDGRRRLTPSARRSLMAPTAGRCRCARIE